jgi:hypothetical protein
VTCGVFGVGDVAEKIAAVEALGRLGGPNELVLLDKMANRKLVFGRSKYESVREASALAAKSIRTRQMETHSLVA